MSADQRIIELLAERPGLKAKDIARQLGLEKRDVNSALYGRLNSKVRQDNQYRWFVTTATSTTATSTTAGPKGRSKQENEEAAPPPKSQTPLARLARYYLDCLAQDSDAGISVYASSWNELDYAPLNTCPLVEEQDFDVFEDEAARKLLNRLRRDRSRLMIYLGYPVRLRRMTSRKGNEFFLLEPLLLFPFLFDGPQRFTKPRLQDDVPVFNMAVLKNLTAFGSGNVMDEAIQLADELGLSSPDGDVPDLDEIAPRLRSARPEWDWMESPNPYELSEGDALSDMRTPGIYNRAVLVVGERSPFTQGLETELGKLEKQKETACDGTALGGWLSGTLSATEVPADDQPLLEVIPLNSEQRQAVQRGLSNPLTVITGPPGTGKSQVVTSLLVNAAWRGMSVLFASKNNKAVDVVETRINSLGPRPILLRLGASEYQNRLAQYLVSLLAATSTAEDQSDFEFHSQAHGVIRERLASLDHTADETIRLRNGVDQLEQEVEETRRELGEECFSQLRSVDLSQFAVGLQQFQSSLRAATRDSQDFLSQLFWFLLRGARFEALRQAVPGVERLADAVDLVLPSLPETDAAIAEWNEFATRLSGRAENAQRVRAYFHSLQQLESATSLEKVARQKHDLIEELSQNSSALWNCWLRLQPKRMGTAERRVLSEYTSLLQMIVAADQDNTRLGADVFRKYHKLFPEIAKTLTCWAITSLSARRIPFEPGFFDLVVIDEASQCDIASAIPLLFRAKRAVIIGDPEQLKHISVVHPRHDRQLLAKHDLVEGHASWAYSVNSLFDLARSMCGGEDIVPLRDHHRSHHDIIGFSNEAFYEGRLRIATRYDRLNRPHQSETAVRWINHTGKVVRPANGGAVNEPEAKAVIDEIRRLVVNNGYRGSVGVVSPFRAQANRIRDLIHQDTELTTALTSADFLADTVHRFQGDERDVILFSPVVSAGVSDGALGFLRSNRNLFNVAITRARAALIVVGDRRAAASSQVDYLAKFSEYAAGLDGGPSAHDMLQHDFGPTYPTVAHPDRVSEWERILYRALYKAGIATIPQYDVEQYALDLAIVDGDRRLDIEVDGERYHRNWDGELCRRDQIRNQRLIELGWDVKRFWVYQVRDDLASCIEQVTQWVSQITASQDG